MSLYQEFDLYLDNSLTGKKEKFKPVKDGYVGMYVCGPTVYNKVHLGNCRTFVSFDLMYRYLLHLGYKVRYVRNITDAGHLENDAEEGEDRIAKKARLDAVEPMEIVQKYSLDFHKILERFNNLPPNIEPTATGHIVEQIETIKKIEKNGLAYERNGNVYFDVLKYNEQKHYGILSGRNLKDMIAHTRDLSGQDDKKNPQDFALWKKAEPQHIMRWPSPWGVGFPGWHLECSVMSAKYLGENFDIHGGGMDLKFPHHECEIAQGQAANNENPVNYWLHANMLTLNGKKMAKSTGNNILPEQIFSGNNSILSKAFSPNVTRFFMLQAHYSSVLDFSDEALLSAEKGFNRITDAINSLDQIKTSADSTLDIEAWRQKCYQAMGDDFNSPVLIAQLFEAVKMVNSVSAGKDRLDEAGKELLQSTLHAFFYDVLGLKHETDQLQNDQSELVDELVQLLIDQRNRARANRDFATADAIRDQLKAKGIQLKDSREGTTYQLENA